MDRPADETVVEGATEVVGAWLTHNAILCFGTDIASNSVLLTFRNYICFLGQTFLLAY